MRKYNYSLIKETTERFELAKGTAEIDYPLGRDDGAVTLARLYGNTEFLDSDYEYRSVGDPDDNGKYRISFKRSGKNLMSGDTYSNLHKVNSTGYGVFGNDFYYIIASVQDNGKMIISRDDLAFKPDTVYTFAACIRYTSTNKTYSPMQAKVVYTDGTDEFIHFTVTGTEVYGVFSTAEGKSIEKVVHYNETSAPTRLILSGFGIFEGAYASYDEAFEPYGAFEGALILNEPLRSVGYVSDILDLCAQRVKRKIYELIIDGEAGGELSEYEGIFRVPLTVRVREDTRVIGMLKKRTLEELFSANSGVAIGEGGNCVYVKLDGISEMRDFIPRVTEDDIRLFFVRENYTEETVIGDAILDSTSGSKTTINTAVPPKKQIMIYKRKD